MRFGLALLICLPLSVFGRIIINYADLSTVHDWQHFLAGGFGTSILWWAGMIWWNLTCSKS